MIVCGILNYNMPHLTDNLFNQLNQIIKTEVEYICFDNGSTEKIAECTTHKIKNNTRLTGGLNHILQIAKKYNPDFVWLCTNDINFKTKIDPIESMINKLLLNQDIGIIHPSMINPVENYAFPWMINNQKGLTKGYPVVDQICPFYTKKALDIIDWKFDERFIYGWGIDYDSCYKIRQNKLKIAVDHDIIIEHQTSAVYDSNKDKEFKNREEYYKKAGENLDLTMRKIFNVNTWEEWRDIINKEI